MLVSIYFTGDAPEMDANMFTGTYYIGVYYPINNSTWDGKVRKSYGNPYDGIEWEAWDPDSRRLLRKVFAGISRYHFKCNRVCL